MKPVLHILTGTTAIGKTDLALAWAEKNNAEIISCDASLFYIGMDIGTAKPTPAQLARVPHHLIDIAPVHQQLDIARYLTLAQKAVAEIQSRNRPILITGGSGFYLKSFLSPVADDIAVPAELRNDIQRQLHQHGLPHLLRQLHQLNPAGLASLDTQNPRRVTRALERCLASGLTLAQLAENFSKLPPPFPGHTIRITELTRTPEDLNTRIAQRTQQMLAAGLIDEVRRLRPLGLEQNPSAASAIGYRETLAFLDGTLTESQLAETIIANTRQLARKQRTWFRTQIPSHRQLPADAATTESLFS